MFRTDSEYVAFAIKTKSAIELRLLLLERPHNEEWSNEVLDVLDDVLLDDDRMRHSVRVDRLA